MPVMGHLPFRRPLPDGIFSELICVSGSWGMGTGSSSSSPSMASHPHRQHTTQPLGKTAGFCHFFLHSGHLPYSSGVIRYPVFGS